MRLFVITWFEILVRANLRLSFASSAPQKAVELTLRFDGASILSFWWSPFRMDEGETVPSEHGSFPTRDCPTLNLQLAYLV